MVENYRVLSVSITPTTNSKVLIFIKEHLPVDYKHKNTIQASSILISKTKSKNDYIIVLLQKTCEL